MSSRKPSKRSPLALAELLPLAEALAQPQLGPSVAIALQGAARLAVLGEEPPFGSCCMLCDRRWSMARMPVAAVLSQPEEYRQGFVALVCRGCLEDEPAMVGERLKSALHELFGWSAMRLVTVPGGRA